MQWPTRACLNWLVRTGRYTEWRDKTPNSNSHIVHRSNSGCWTGVLVTLIGSLCGTDPYSFMKEHVISLRKSHFKQVLCTNGWPYPTNGTVHVRLWIHNDSRFYINVKVIPLLFYGTCADFGIIWHLWLKNLTASTWASSIHNNSNNNNNDNNNNNNNNNDRS